VKTTSLDLRGFAASFHTGAKGPALYALSGLCPKMIGKRASRSTAQRWERLARAGAKSPIRPEAGRPIDARNPEGLDADFVSDLQHGRAISPGYVGALPCRRRRALRGSEQRCTHRPTATTRKRSFFV
jgi:hypothetical protein